MDCAADVASADRVKIPWPVGERVDTLDPAGLGRKSGQSSEYGSVAKVDRGLDVCRLRLP